ncbi:hypothetical protein [Shewanella sp. Isolate11]|uniref:hypothetical protein n=1 Tax=Shewanella sp. Isolate11 TaxID=2908530 RepID=UPI001EFE4744|nr:hypothetical protein [Shewanella sp. Isolate11]MCG9695743.1 hypothetical protein [Shewanella sp. Isolate11]
MHFWFDLIDKWVKSGRGQYGISFPFLVGAIALKTKEKSAKNLIDEIFENIISNPVPGYYCEVRWCGKIKEPVASIKEIESIARVAIKDKYDSGGQVSLAFTTDLMSMFNLDCETKEECVLKLKDLTMGIVEKGVFSKNCGAFTEFTNDDLVFINQVYEKI